MNLYAGHSCKIRQLSALKSTYIESILHVLQVSLVVLTRLNILKSNKNEIKFLFFQMFYIN